MNVRPCLQKSYKYRCDSRHLHYFLRSPLRSCLSRDGIPLPVFGRKEVAGTSQSAVEKISGKWIIYDKRERKEACTSVIGFGKWLRKSEKEFGFHQKILTIFGKWQPRRPTSWLSTTSSPSNLQWVWWCKYFWYGEKDGFQGNYRVFKNNLHKFPPIYGLLKVVKHLSHGEKQKKKVSNKGWTTDWKKID